LTFNGFSHFTQIEPFNVSQIPQNVVGISLK
jgi:hypothetical protein